MDNDTPVARRTITTGETRRLRILIHDSRGRQWLRWGVIGGKQ